MPGLPLRPAWLEIDGLDYLGSQLHDGCMLWKLDSFRMALWRPLYLCITAEYLINESNVSFL